MKKYKSLLFRELKISKKHYISHALLMAFFAAMLLFSVFVGWKDDIANANKQDMSEFHAALGMFAFMFSFLTSILAAYDTDIYQADKNTGWLRYSYALPITAKEKALTRYAVKTAAVIIGGIISTALAAAIGPPFGYSFAAGAINVYLLALDSFMLFELISASAMAAGWSEKKAKLLEWGILILIFGGGIIAFLWALAFGGLMEKLQETMLEDPEFMERFMGQILDFAEGMSVIPVIVFIALLVGSVFTAIKLFERREP